MEIDNVTIGTMFMSQIIELVVKFMLKKNGITFKRFDLKKLEITHGEDRLLNVKLNLNAQMDEDQFIAVLKTLGIV